MRKQPIIKPERVVGITSVGERKCIGTDLSIKFAIHSQTIFTIRSHTDIDFLLIGQGLAGSCLAVSLWKEKKKIVIIDEPANNRASAIAAGLFNPVTGKLMSKTWRADDLFVSLSSFYREAERQLNAKFFYPFPLYRPFLSVEEQNEWMGKSAEPGMMHYIDQVFTSSAFANHIHDPIGGLLLKECGYLDTNGFMQAVRNQLNVTGSFLDEHFDESQLETHVGKFLYKGIQSEKIIYCNGLGALQSRYFNTLPLRPLKGETLSIKTGEILPRIYNRGVYMAPAGAFTYKVGATYNTKDKDPGTSAEGKAELTEKLNSLLKIPYEITGHDWGIRPTTPDRRPILGAHPHHPSVVIFNGLGTKGVSLAPFFATQLTNWLTGKGEIDPSVSVDRFY